MRHPPARHAAADEPDQRVAVETDGSDLAATESGPHSRPDHGASSTGGEVIGPVEWSRLLHEERGRLTALALLFADSPEDAEELLADVLCSLVRKPRRVADPIAYLARALRHAAATRHRRRQSRRRVLEVRGEIAPGQNPDPSSTGADVRPDADTLLCALDDLDDIRREVVVLHVRAGLTFAQIAACLGLSRNTVASHYRRGIDALRRTLSKESHDER